METGNNVLEDPELLEYFDLSFSEEPANYYILILELHEFHVRACWYHKSKNLVTGFAQYPLKNGLSHDSLSKLLNDRPYLASEFDQCICVSYSDNYSIIPSSISDSDAQDLFKIANPFQEGQQLRTQQLLNIDARVYYQPMEEEESILMKTIRNAELVSRVGAGIEHALNQKHKGNAKNGVFVQIDASRIHVIAVHDGKLVLCNNYYHASAEDIAYYILYAAEVLNIDPEKDTLYLSGEISIGSDQWKLLSKYWLNVKLDISLKGISISNKLEDRPKGQFDHLTHHLLCAS